MISLKCPAGNGVRGVEGWSAGQADAPISNEWLSFIRQPSSLVSGNELWWAAVGD